MWMILQRLYLGDARDARDLDLLEECGITHVLNCAYDVPCYHDNRLEYLHLELADPDPQFADCIPDICDFIAIGRQSGTVLVHCRMALSRSPAAILAYLCHLGMTLDQGIDLLRKGVGERENFILPSEVFMEQLRDYFEQAG
jgi:dual specificity MAP kinase phosphatase